MREFINPERVANKVRMMRTQFPGSFLIVEGDADTRFYRNLVNREKCKIFSGYGKANVIHILNNIILAVLFRGLEVLNRDFNPCYFNTF
ncbi:MAG: hypothetical protein AAFO04_23795 [Cyanobacteria bacterium J06592_8]